MWEMSEARATHLTVVARKVHVMQGVMSGRVDEPFQKVTRNHVPIMDLPLPFATISIAHFSRKHQSGTYDDGPQVDNDKQTKVDPFVEGQDEGDNVVRHRLSVSVQGVESKRSKWGRD